MSAWLAENAWAKGGLISLALITVVMTVCAWSIWFER